MLPIISSGWTAWGDPQHSNRLKNDTNILRQETFRL
jgi:hypothetical protein